MHTTTEPFQFKRFQKEDLARIALHPGGVLGWDPGLGKTIAMYVWGLLKTGLHKGERVSGTQRHNRLQPNGAILMVAPGDLHDQIASDGRELFHTVPTALDSQATFLRLSTVHPKRGARQLPPGYYLTSYTQLTGNGVAEFPRLNCIDPLATLRELGHDLAEVEDHFNRRAVLYRDECEFMNVTANDPLGTIEGRYLLCQRANSDNEAFLKQLDEVYQTLRHFHTATRNPQFHQLAADQVHFIALQAARMKHQEYSSGIGQERSYGGRRVRCVYSPALVDLCQDCFAVVIADEATKIQGEETIIGTGTRQLNPLYRLVMTATPIKNRLPSVFRLAWWGTGGLPDAHARFPYPDAADAREDFANEFMVSERNLTKEEVSASRTGHHRRYSKLTPQVCNVHRLWKLFAPVILRRRKKDCGEDIVQKHRHVLRVPMGTFQARVYQYHLNAKYTDHKGKPAIGAQLQALRVAAAEPSSASLIAKAQQHDRLLTLYRSPYSYTPKLAATLNLIKEIMERGEQVIIFHTFLDSIDVMSARLNEAGVRHLVMDGRTSPAKRGKLAAQFKRGVPGGIPVMLANSDCMAAGHSFSLCGNGVHYSYQWALDLTLQSDDRYYRINSPNDVNSYRTVCNGSIDLRMEAQAEEKSDAAELVLDGQLMQKHVEELNHAELLRIAWRDFSNKDTIDERELMKSWPKLRWDLATAAWQWGGGTGSGKRNETSNNEQRTLITEMGLTVIPFPQPRPLAPELADLPLFATR